MNRTKKIKKQTKKEIYASFGIEYKAGKIYHPLFGWIRPVLKKGNEKLGKSVSTFSTLAGTIIYNTAIEHCESIKGTCPCDCKGCYAKVGRYVFQNVIESNARNTFLATCDIDFLYRAIMAQIKADDLKTIRIHASGDFMSIEYIDTWIRIVENNPTAIFWTYTKNPAAESAFDSLDNCNVIKSIIQGYGLNFGKCGYILDTYNALKAAGESVYICRCGIDKNQHCESCNGCTNHKYVLFIEHSTDYKAEQDPLFDTLKAVIESQPKVNG